MRPLRVPTLVMMMTAFAAPLSAQVEVGAVALPAGGSGVAAAPAALAPTSLSALSMGLTAAPGAVLPASSLSPLTAPAALAGPAAVRVPAAAPVPLAAAAPAPVPLKSSAIPAAKPAAVQGADPARAAPAPEEASRAGAASRASDASVPRVQIPTAHEQLEDLAGRDAESAQKFDGAAARAAAAAPEAGALDGMVSTERRILKDWGSLDAAGRARASESLVDAAFRDMSAAGYTVRKVRAGEDWKLVIDAMPGRQGVFMRRIQALGGAQAPAFEYSPAALGVRQGSGAQFDTVTNTLEFDAASLAITHSGSLALVKHELRHGRQGKLLAAGIVNDSHGWFAFADEAPRRELGIYEADFQVDELLTYSKQQQDTANDLRRALARIRREGTGFLGQGNNRNLLESSIKQADKNYYGVMNMARALKESVDALRSALRAAGPAVVGTLEGNPSHTYAGRDGKESVVIEFFRHERLGPDGLAAVQFPAVRKGRAVADAEGEPARDLLAVPIAKGAMAALEKDPAAARAYVETYLAGAARDAESRRAAVLSRQEAVQALVDEVRVAASK